MSKIAALPALNRLDFTVYVSCDIIQPFNERDFLGDARNVIGSVHQQTQFCPVGPEQSRRCCIAQAASADHQYIICADDDVALHPCTIKESVSALREDPQAFMLTGKLPSVHQSYHPIHLTCGFRT